MMMFQQVHHHSLLKPGSGPTKQIDVESLAGRPWKAVQRTIPTDNDDNGISHTLNGKDLSAYSDDLNLADGNWHHIAVTYDATTGDRTIYIDGAKKATDKPEVTASDTETVTATDIKIGVDQNDQYFDGTIESTLIWNRSLSEAEIIKRQTIPSSGNESGLVALHRFNEGNGNQVDAEGTTDSDLTAHWLEVQPGVVPQQNRRGSQ